MNNLLTAMRLRLERHKGELNGLTRSVELLEEKKKKQKKDEERCRIAQRIIQEVAQQTQEQLEYRLTELVTLALTSIFGEEAPVFKLNFIIRRGKTEVDIVFDHNGCQVTPMDGDGGGAVDIASFALRLSLWSLSNKHRGIIVLDEPFRFLSSDLQPKAGLLLKRISELLNIQFIMVTHEEELTEGADKVFKVVKRNDVSKVTEETI